MPPTFIGIGQTLIGAAVGAAIGGSAFTGTFWASFDVDQNADYAAGSPTGTLHGGATVSGGLLDVYTTAGNKYCDWSAVSNADSAQKGCVRMGIVPQYTGFPSASKSTFFITTRADGNGLNQVSLWHNSGTGTLEVYIRESTGAAITTKVLGVWNAVAGQEYEFELNWDIDNGIIDLFVDGGHFGDTQAGTGTRDGNNALLRIGSGASVGAVPEYKVNYIKIWATPQHTDVYATSSLWADFETSGDLVTYGGTPTATLSGSATISGGALVMTGGGAGYARYDATSNWQPTDKGTVVTLYKPNYSGAPSAGRTIWARGRSGSSLNMMRLDHNATTGTFTLWARTAAGTYINSTATTAAWSPTAGQTYEITVVFDFATGDTRIYIDGTQFDVPITGTGAMTVEASNFIWLGTDQNAANHPDCSILDFQVYDGVLLHMSSFATPDMRADYEIDQNLTIYGGSATGTLHGTATVSGGALVMAGATGGTYCEYGMDSNWQPTTLATIKVIFKPNYSGTPTGTQTIFHRGRIADSRNMIRLDHNATAGTFTLWIRDAAGTYINSTAFTGAWAPTAGRAYDIEVNMDLATGATRLFIDGTQWDITLTGTGALTVEAGNVLRIGTETNGTNTPNFDALDVKVWNQVQHVANF